MKPGGEKISAMELLAQLQGSGSQFGATQSLDLSHYARLALRNIWAILTTVFLCSALKVFYPTIRN
ncbi:MAG: hypothetical protein ACOVMP_04705 [Chthoniobacterales bacterium]